MNTNDEIHHYDAYPVDMAHRCIDLRPDLTPEQKQRLHTALANRWPHTTYPNVY